MSLFCLPLVLCLLAAGLTLSPKHAEAQMVRAGEVRQLVTFRFLPGMAGEGMERFRAAVPLYEQNPAMQSFRAYREVESPVELDLVVVSSFDGMRGMDASNEALAMAAEQAGTSVGAVYGAIAEASSGHDDQFVEMIPRLSQEDPSQWPLLALVWYRVAPGEGDAFEAALEQSVVSWEREAGAAAATGRFLVSDGWHYLRFLGFDSLGAYQAYWEGLREVEGYEAVEALTVLRREVILAPVRDLWVR